jgi:hypothetical protein
LPVVRCNQCGSENLLFKGWVPAHHCRSCEAPLDLKRRAADLDRVRSLAPLDARRIGGGKGSLKVS